MSYNPTNWLDRISANPGQFTATGSVPGNVILSLNDSPTQAGTQFTAAHMNNIESGIAALDEGNITGPISTVGIAGATATSRYVGATTSGAPTTGTFLVGDWAIDQSGFIWICVTAGTPGTWAKPGNTGYQIITSTGIFIVPLGIVCIYVELIGGGGGGAGATGGIYAQGAAGAGAGGYVAGWLHVTPLQVITGVIGAGGTAGNGSSTGIGAAGGVGGSTTFLTFTAYGGNQSLPGAGAASTAGVGGLGLGAPLITQGQTGNQVSTPPGGLGGNAANGAYTYGEGGQGGSGQNNNVGTNGVAGGNGAIIVTW
ncbi:membrane hypothetical protein [Candidatus Desulfosporosinus infrequens]|uniref:Glycine-rich domain-containing protein n=1 Tax=Candidatus Desulfosporosinus infrequens TaxID=2043169 RepID=A0A2U3LHF1_9FIRM|nr:membrane hypothetical protein [Candidatus Desulfosporosinus infrequens]